MLQILLVSNRPGMPWPAARWRLQNLASGPGRAEADRADVEAFPPASPETFGLRVLPGKPLPSSTWIHDDLLRGALPDGRFVGMRCGRDPDPDRDRLTACKLWFDWRQGAPGGHVHTHATAEVARDRTSHARAGGPLRGRGGGTVTPQETGAATAP